ncbi:hypothetical protein P9G84_30855 [Brevibacillus centrosporus]|nr:hypothetical protein [Brevibacillus centrosporus]MEC2133256.1 hypothetical protein [Brevibacillus centrosporus]
MNLQQTNVSDATWQDVRAERLIKETANTIPMGNYEIERTVTLPV